MVWVLVAFIAAVGRMSFSAPAAHETRIGILVVGTKQDAATVTQGGALMAELHAMREQKGYSKQQLGLFIWDYSSSMEVAASAARFGITPHDLVFAGVVRVGPDNRLLAILSRHARVQDAHAVAQVVFAEAEAQLGRFAHNTPAPGRTPQSTSYLPHAPKHGGELRNPKDGSVLIEIPGGSFTMGSNDEQPDEKPSHAVTLAPYAIGKYDVTNAQFRRFVEETVYDAGTAWKEYAEKWGSDSPVVCVSWYDANAYCRWAGLRLPTEAEWEYAARGSDSRKYPWGNEWDASRAVCGENSGNRAQPVGSRPNGASPFGCLDMAGNVEQWCSSKYRPYPYNAGDGREEPGGSENRVMRGGYWMDPGYFCRCSRRYAVLPPVGRYNSFGFRCAKSL